MKLGEYINLLQGIEAEHGGELEVDTYGPSFSRMRAKAPKVGYRKILGKRESKSAFWSEGDDPESQGEKVIMI